MMEKQRRFRKHIFILALLIISSIGALRIINIGTSSLSKIAFSISDTEAINHAVDLSKSLAKTEFGKKIVWEIQFLLNLSSNNHSGSHFYSKDEIIFDTEIFDKIKVEMDKVFESNDNEFGKAVSTIEAIIKNHFPDDQFNVGFPNIKYQLEYGINTNTNTVDKVYNTDYGRPDFKYYLGYRLLLLNGLDTPMIISFIPKTLSSSGWTTYFTELTGTQLLLDSLEVTFSPSSKNINLNNYYVNQKHKIDKILVTPFKISQYDYRLQGNTKTFTGFDVKMVFSGDSQGHEEINAYGQLM
jgi:hypothetical protein